MTHAPTHPWRRWRCSDVRGSAVETAARGWISSAEPRRRSDWPRPNRTNRRKTTSPTSAEEPTANTPAKPWALSIVQAYQIYYTDQKIKKLIMRINWLWFGPEILGPSESPQNRDRSSPERSEATTYERTHTLHVSKTLFTKNMTNNWFKNNIKVT